MKARQAVEIAKQSSTPSTTQAATTSSPKTTGELSKEGKRFIADVVSRTFAEFQRYWPRKFASIWPTAEAVRDSKNAWYREFCRTRMTETSFARGLDQARKEKWPPDNPGEFLALCRIEPADVGAPDSESAWAIACRMTHPGSPDGKGWAHPAVRAAARKVGFSRLFYSGIRAKRDFLDAYQDAVDWADNLDPLPEAALPEKLSPEEEAERDQAAAEGLASIKQLVKGL